MNVRRSAAFTLIEILIVLVILGILAATLVPQLAGLGADKSARITATRTNLQTLNHAVKQYRIKNGRYPERLETLLTETYRDAGTVQAYLKTIPPELVSSGEGGNGVDNVEGMIHLELDPARLPGDGGWVYLVDSATVLVDVNQPLGSDWGDHEGEQPWTW